MPTLDTLIGLCIKNETELTTALSYERECASFQGFETQIRL